VFEYNGKFYNPRFVFSIGKVDALANGRGAFDVFWHGVEASRFGFDTLKEAEQQRKLLAVHVDNCNGV